MADAINDGGPAFPVVFDHGEAVSEHDGMSLRDHFAGLALPPVMYTCQYDDLDGAGAANRAELYAKRAYEVADAMLKARQS